MLRNINNIYYNTSEEEKMRPTDPNMKYGITLVNYNWVNQKNDNSYSSSQQSKPQLPKNANIISG